LSSGLLVRISKTQNPTSLVEIWEFVFDSKPPLMDLIYFSIQSVLKVRFFVNNGQIGTLWHKRAGSSRTPTHVQAKMDLWFKKHYKDTHLYVVDWD
jgi:hypothetical protein